MRLTFIGLTLSSSWGNGHATTYRALLSALHAQGHELVFLEEDQRWYAAHRDLKDPDYCSLRFYRDVVDLRRYRDTIARSDAVIVGSYVPDGIAVARFLRQVAHGPVLFYDIDTPVTLAAIEAGACSYLDRDTLRSYDSYLSFTGGPTLARLESQLGARSAHALYCCVDADLHRPIAAEEVYALGYLGTYSPDRQPGLETLLIEPARKRPDLRFIVAGPQYPAEIEWPSNVERIDHVAPAEHARFYARCRFTLNVTRADMRAAGFSPSVRLFEAAAVGTPIISDFWEGIEEILEPGREIIIARNSSEVLGFLSMDTEQRDGIARAARRRVLADHTKSTRARQLAEIVAGLCRGRVDAGLVRA